MRFEDHLSREVWERVCWEARARERRERRRRETREMRRQRIRETNLMLAGTCLWLMIAIGIVLLQGCTEDRNDDTIAQVSPDTGIICTTFGEAENRWSGQYA
jgi:hypothetical protein